MGRKNQVAFWMTRPGPSFRSNEGRSLKPTKKELEHPHAKEMQRIVDKLSVPEHMHAGIFDWLVYGVQPGGFLSAVLANDLVEAFARADDINQRSMLKWAQYLYNEAPVGSWGSVETCERWAERFGCKFRYEGRVR